MTNYEKYKKMERSISRIEYVIWGAIAWALSIMVEGGLTVNVPVVALGVSALIAIPAITLHMLITDPIENYYMKKDFEKDDEA